MKSKFCFQIFTSCTSGSFSSQLESLEEELALWMLEHSLCFDRMLQCRIYLTDAANQWAALQESELYQRMLSLAAVSYIEQPLLNGSKIALQVCFATTGEVVKTGTPDCMQVRVGEVTYLFHSVRFTAEEVNGLDAAGQTRLAFQRHLDLLQQKKMNLAQHCHRTWIYVRDIDRHYAGVVTGRNQVFAEQGLTADTHYITSTGIGGYTDNPGAIVGIDFLSIDGVETDHVQYLHALDYLNPTHEYGVAFERGTKLILPEGDLLLISGTASIDKTGECVHRGEVMTQAGRLFLNIEKLLEDGGASLSDMAYMIVYLRDISDYRAIETYLQLRFPRIPFLITEARVCRPEWLIEVEGMALRSRR